MWWHRRQASAVSAGEAGNSHTRHMDNGDPGVIAQEITDGAC
jgi:hypothetical protein